MITKEKINQAGYFLIGKINRLSRADANNTLKEFRAIHQHPMALFRHLIDRKLNKHKTDALVSQRLKRIPSITKKLKIQKNMKLSRMQDIGGLRIVVDNINEVNLIKNAIRKTENHRSFTFTFANEKDYLKMPPESGYRGIHLIYKYDKNIVLEKQCRVEIQIRTKLQHSWATAVEVLGTYLNQPLKQSFGDEEYLDIFKKISKLFVGLEKRNTSVDYEFIKELKKDIENVQLLNKLQGFSIASKHLKNNTEWVLLKMDFKNRNVRIKEYIESKFEQANKDYLQMELEYLDNSAIEVVLLSIQNIKKLKQSYPNYFMDTTEFVENLEKIFQSVEEIQGLQDIIKNSDDKKRKIELEKMLDNIVKKNTFNVLGGKK